MADIYAVCLSISQGAGDVTVRAHLLHSDDDRTTEASVSWPSVPPINAEGNSSEWLYSVLSRMLMNYDDHIVTEASTHSAAKLSPVVQREA